MILQYLNIGAVLQFGLVVAIAIAEQKILGLTPRLNSVIIELIYRSPSVVATDSGFVPG